MACDKIVGYTDFTAQQSVAGMPTPEADLTHDIEGVDGCGNAGILMGQSSYNLVQQDLRDGIIRMPTFFSPKQRWEDITVTILLVGPVN